MRASFRGLDLRGTDALMSPAARCMAGKSGRDRMDRWLPLWMHLADTAGIMEKLVRHWLPASLWEHEGFDMEEWLALSIFLALTHDLGKATALFQSNILSNVPEIIETISMSLLWV